MIDHAGSERKASTLVQAQALELKSQAVGTTCPICAAVNQALIRGNIRSQLLQKRRHLHRRRKLFDADGGYRSHSDRSL